MQCTNRHFHWLPYSEFKSCNTLTLSVGGITIFRSENILANDSTIRFQIAVTQVEKTTFVP